ncbi:MAG: Rieske 2Fe-2S domain-containing protein, partial [Acidimicrobiia bacterium]|nr:Rieske 2Fe-2S domain-containing protein [Acidimicrobiia bacterium]
METTESSAYTRPQRVMDPSVYLDEDLFDREQRSLLSSTWQYACHRSELGRPGSYITFEVAGEPLFTVSDREGAIRTFYNVCMHRGHRLVQGSGVRPKLV